MPDKMGPLLRSAMGRMSRASSSAEAAIVASALGGADDDSEDLPIVIKVPTLEPQPGEEWHGYRERVEAQLEPLREKLKSVMGIDAAPLIAANALQAQASPEQIEHLGTQSEVSKMELDPVEHVTLLDDADDDIALPGFRLRHPTLDGGGVKVAVLDSGIDTKHPALTVSDSVSTNGQSVNIPGKHGTHCAGIIASSDSIFGGVAPKVTLLNIKVLAADGSGRHTDITKGVDEALDRGAQVLSMSLGFNHLPRWSNRGHGWSCTNGHCPLCTAVDNAVTLDNVVAVVAAGNEHDRAQALRAAGSSASFDTELACPGQSRKALTVGAISKQLFQLASFSSRGPTSYGTAKPDLCAPGVNITSTIPVPRNPSGGLVANPSRSSLFARDSGTSMATPFVAGAVALLIQKRVEAGTAWTPDDIRQDLQSGGLGALIGTSDEIGGGRLYFGNL